jgi:hypothetical protein
MQITVDIPTPNAVEESQQKRMADEVVDKVMRELNDLGYSSVRQSLCYDCDHKTDQLIGPAKHEWRSLGRVAAMKALVEPLRAAGWEVEFKERLQDNGHIKDFKLIVKRP